MDTYRAIEALCDISRDLVATHGSEEYNEISATYPSKAERDLRPAAFAIPRNRDDVVAVLDTLKHFGDKVPLAIAGAGLLPVLGSANVEGGITIHMCHFKGIQINSDNSIVRISPGETWESLCEVLEPRGLSVSGSRGDVSTKGTACMMFIYRMIELTSLG
jgi:FAD/FMN-containing dehydrogenase